jgi:putative serine protease PepD
MTQTHQDAWSQSSGDAGRTPDQQPRAAAQGTPQQAHPQHTDQPQAQPNHQQGPGAQPQPARDPFARPADGTAPDGTAPDGTAPDGSVPDVTGPVWYGQTRELPTAAPVGAPPAQERTAFGTYAGHPAYPSTTQPPAGPPPSVTARGGAEPAQPAKRRRLTELTAVAVLAALLASGGTFAAAQLLDDSQSSSSATTSSLGRGTNTAPVVQADRNNPNWTATAAAVSPSVVAITVAGAQGEGQGSGVIIDDKGHVLTNNHVVSGAGSDAKLTVTLNDGRSFQAKVAGTDPSTDLAVITLANAPSDLRPIAMGDSEALKVGDPVMAVGNPLGLAGTVTTGIVSALNRPVTTQAEGNDQQQQDQNPFGQGSPFGQGGQGQGQQPQTGNDSVDVVTNAIQTSAAINPGNSGGALVNASGQLVGINSSIASLGSSSGGQSGSIGIGFAIPVNEAKDIASQLIEKGKAEHAVLGVTTRDGSASDGASQRAGAQIAEVTKDSPAAAAGLKSGDVVIKVNNDPVNSSESLVASIRELGVGDKVSLTVLRDGKEQTVTATLAAKPTTS